MIVRRQLLDNDRLRVVYSRRTRDEPAGRFGGGWQWKVGVQASSRRYIIVNLLVADLWIETGPRKRFTCTGSKVWRP